MACTSNDTTTTTSDFWMIDNRQQVLLSTIKNPKNGNAMKALLKKNQYLPHDTVEQLPPSHVLQHHVVVVGIVLVELVQFHHVRVLQRAQGAHLSFRFAFCFVVVTAQGPRENTQKKNKKKNIQIMTPAGVL